MTKVWIGDYVSFDAETQGDELLPLLECLRYASATGIPFDEYFRSLFGEHGPAGGDPGWSIHWIESASEAEVPDEWLRCMEQVPQGDRGCFEAWTNQRISELDPPYGYYPKEVVRHYVKEVLDNYRAKNPSEATDVDAAIRRFKLEGA